jgi:hypothetical protein
LYVSGEAGAEHGEAGRDLQGIIEVLFRFPTGGTECRQLFFSGGECAFNRRRSPQTFTGGKQNQH